ncbi:MAG: DMT family transporter [Pseudomonadota bacterium]
MAYNVTTGSYGTTQRAALSANTEAIGFLIIGVAVFSVQDVIVKIVSDTYSITQLLCVRSLIALPLLLAFARLQDGGVRLRTARPWLNLLRSALMFAAFFSFYLAVSAVPLSVAVAIAFSSPIVITLVSAWVLGEVVGVRRFAALTAGFAGVLLITQPGTAQFEPAALFAVICAVAYGCAQVIGRVLGRDHASGQLSVYSAGFYLCASTGLAALMALGSPDGTGQEAGTAPAWMAFLTRAWVPMPLDDLLLIAATGVISAVGFVSLAHAYKIGEPSAVAPYEYTGILWALVFGVVLWGDIPGLTAMCGMALIVASGSYILWRERVGARRVAAAAPGPDHHLTAHGAAGT